MMKSRFVKITALVVAIIIIAGIAVSAYLSRVVAPPIVNKQIQIIEAQYPNEIKSITYGSVSYTVFGALTHSFTIKDLQINSKGETNAAVRIESLTVDHYNAFETNPVGSFGVKIKNLSLQNVGNVYTYVMKMTDTVKGLNSDPFINVFKNVPPNFDQLKADCDFQYDADAKTLTFNLNANQGDALMIQSQGKLGSIILTGSLNDFQNNLANMVTIQNNMKLHMQGDIAVNDLQAAAPTVGNFFKSLNYTDLPFSIDDNGSYVSDMQTMQSQLTFKIDNVGSLAVNMTILEPPAAMNAKYLASYAYLKGGNATPPAQANTQTQLQSFQATYTDLSFMTRLYAYIAQTSGKTTQKVQSDLVQDVQDAGELLGLPVFDRFAPTLTQFIQNPKNITVAIHPTTPLSLDPDSMSQLTSLSSDDLVARLNLNITANQ